MITYTLSDASGESSGWDYLTTQEIKNYCQVDASADDTLLDELFYAVAGEIERRYKQITKKRNVNLYFDKREKYHDLMFRPVSSVTSVTYTTSTDSTGTLTETTNYKVYGSTSSRARSLELEFFANWDELDVVINCDGSTVPYDIKLATLAWIKTLYDERVFFDDESPPPPPEKAVLLLRKYEPMVL